MRWIGGGSGAGKSTVARRLAQRYGLALYATDESMADHAARCDAALCPQLAAFAAMDFDARWLDRSVETMLDTFHWFRGEVFDLIVEDLVAMPSEIPILVEGFRLLPRLVEPLLSAPRQAVWLLPTPGFRRAAFESRGGLMAIAGRTRDPPRALAKLLERDHLFTLRLRQEAAALGLSVIEAREGDAVEALEAAVALSLGLPPHADGALAPDGPVA